MTMVIAILVALALSGSTLASVTISNGRELANSCEDNSDFRYRKKGRRDCAWVGNSKKKENLCKKRSVKKNCKETCGLCEDISDCPKTHKKMKKLHKKKTCDGYETGLQCGYDYVYTGCSNGHPNCSPQQIYTCNEGLTTKEWELITIPPLTGDPRCDEALYGESCDPGACPATMPAWGDSCALYTGTDPCGYRPEWVGCNPDNWTCQNVLEAICDPDNLKWRVIPVEHSSCPWEPRSPLGLPCDLDNPTLPTPAPLPEPCDEEPEEGGDCLFGTDETCYGGYLVQGCTSDTLFCSPGLSYTCSEKGSWEKEFLPQIQCIADDPLWGTACDPDEPIGVNPTPAPLPGPCEEEPEAGSSCSFGSDKTCYGGYSNRSCDPGTFQCSPGISYTCSEEGTWTVEFLPQTLCITDDPLFGTACDPFDCPPIKPIEGIGCNTGSWKTCYYDFEWWDWSHTFEQVSCRWTTEYRCVEAPGGNINIWSEKIIKPDPGGALDPRKGECCRDCP